MELSIHVHNRQFSIINVFFHDNESAKKVMATDDPVKQKEAGASIK